MNEDKLSKHISFVRRASSFRQACTQSTVRLSDPQANAVRVRHTYVGVNGLFDTEVAAGRVKAIQPQPGQTMGVEAVGVVEAVGRDVTTFKPGDAAGSIRFGSGYCLHRIAPEDAFVPLPKANPAHLTLLTTGVSAWVGLFEVAKIKAGETIAITAAAGGLGHILVQLAKSKGATVIAICGGPEKAALCRRLGADVVLDRKAIDVPQHLAQTYQDRLDVAFDTVGGAIFDAFVEAVAPRGRLIVSGIAAEMGGRPIETITGPRLNHALYWKGASVLGFMNALHTEAWPKARAALFQAYAEGAIAVNVDCDAGEGLEAVFDAVDRLINGENTGKVVVKL